MDEPLVSVSMVTFNHERFVSQAIDSVLMQRTDFSVELVVGEDCSTDSTRDLVIEYQRRYPSRVRTVLRAQNVGMMRNFAETLRACRGKYVALLDGDDYWTSPYKLQRQVDFLESHPQYVECFHPVAVVRDGEVVESSFPGRGQQAYTFDDLLEGNCIGTCSAFVRRRAVETFPEWIFSFDIGDWPMHLWNAVGAPIGCVDECMGVYRLHHDGAWSRLSKARRLESNIRFLLTFAARLEDTERARRVLLQVARQYTHVAFDAYRAGERAQAYAHMFKAAKYESYTSVRAGLRKALTFWPRLQRWV